MGPTHILKNVLKSASHGNGEKEMMKTVRPGNVVFVFESARLLRGWTSRHLKGGQVHYYRDARPVKMLMWNRLSRKRLQTFTLRGSSWLSKMMFIRLSQNGYGNNFSIR